MSWITPDWPASRNVRALMTTRRGGVSTGPYGSTPDDREGMNVGLASGDDVAVVASNRARLRAVLPSEPRWLTQIHGALVVDAAQVDSSVKAVADASFTDAAGVVCVVSVADCMPVFLADVSGRCVGVAHAGWRGIAAGVIQATAQAMRRRLENPSAKLLAYLGPAIGPQHFEVGAEVLDAMLLHLPDAATAFKEQPHGKYLADLFTLGRQALDHAGVGCVYGGRDCTYSDPALFYSYRRERPTGRHAALIWLV